MTKCFHVNYSGIVKHHADDTSGCYLKGSRRNELKAKLENVNPRRQYLENLQTLAEDVFESGNRDDAPNVGVLTKARQDAQKIQVLDKSEIGALQKMFLHQQDNGVGEKLPGVLRKWSGEPRSVMLWSEDTLRIYHDRTRFDACLH